MLKNLDYNLFESISNISKSLYRYETYVKDAERCKACQEIWENFKKQREKELAMLLKELRTHAEASPLLLKK